MAALGSVNVFPFPEAQGERVPTTVSGRAFNGALERARGVPARVAAPFVPGQNKMRAIGTGTLTEFNNHNLNIGTGALAGVLSGHQVPPNEADGWEAAPPTSLADLANRTNSPVPMLRIIQAPEMYDLTGLRELLFIKKTVSESMRVRRGQQPKWRGLFDRQRDLAPSPGGASPWGKMQVNAMQVYQNQLNADYEYADARPVLGANLRYLNYLLYEYQAALFKTNPKRYMELTPLEIWYGAGDLPWTGWFCDGIVRLEEAYNGASTRRNDAMGPPIMVGPNLRLGASGNMMPATKMVSCVRYGEVQAHNIFESRGIQTGSRHYLVLTKKELGSGTGKVTFVMSSKADTISQNMTGTYRISEIGAEAMDPATKMPAPKGEFAADAHYYKRMVHGFRPFLLYPVTSADGGSLDPSFFYYENEMGVTHPNALRLEIGTTLFPPFEYRPEMPLLTPSDPGFKPCTNGTVEMQRMPFPGVLLKVFKDGYLDQI